MKSLSKKEWIGVIVAIVFIGYTMFGQTISNFFSGNGSGTINNEASAALSDSSNQNNMSNVTTKDILVGNGTTIAPGMVVVVNYVLKLSDGTLIQDSKQVNGGAPFSFVFGAGQLIPGWEMGITGMKVGGKRLITIPPELGYGSSAVGPIPANSTLVFEIEVVDAKLSDSQ